jgi:translocation and assembly module TamB
MEKSVRWKLPAMLLGLVIIVSISGGWLLGSTSGLRWVVATVTHSSVSQISLINVTGTLLGDMGAKTLVINSRDLRITAHDIHLTWRPASLLSGGLEIDELGAQDIEVLSRPALPSKNGLPENLQLPLPVLIKKVSLGALRIISEENGVPYFSATNLAASLESNGRQHHVQYLSANLEYGKLLSSGQINGSRPFALQAKAELIGLTDHTESVVQDAHLSAIVNGNLEQLSINMTGSGAGLSAKGEAQLRPLSPFALTTLRFQIDGFNPRTFSPAAPQARLLLLADLSSNADGQLNGNVTAKNTMPAPLNRDGLPLLEARAHVTLSAKLVQFDQLGLVLTDGGRITGNVSWQRDRSTGSANLNISRLNPAALDTRLRAARLNGSLTVSGDHYAEQGEMTLTDGTLHLDARLARAGNHLTLNKLRLIRNQTILTGQGQLTLDGSQSFILDGKLQHFDIADFLHSPRSDINAAFEMNGNLKSKTTGKVRFTMNKSHLAGQSVTGHGLVEFVSNSSIHGEAEVRLGDNSLHVHGGFGIEGNQLQFSLAAPVLAQLGIGYSGAVNAHASLAGNIESPELNIEIEAHDLTLPNDHHLDSLSANATLHGEALTLMINAAEYRINNKLMVQNLKFSGNGDRSNHNLDAEVNLQNGNKVTLHAKGGFTDFAQNWRNIEWQGALTELAGTTTIPFDLVKATPLTIGREHVSLGDADFSVAGGQALFRSTEWTTQRWHSQGSFTGIRLRTGIGLGNVVIADKEPEVLQLGGNWNITSTTQLLGFINIARESGDWVLPGDPTLPLGLRTLQFNAHSNQGQLVAELTVNGDRFGDWYGSATVPLSLSGANWSVAGNAPLAGKVRIKVNDLSWIGSSINDSLKSAGKLELEADVAGTFTAPHLRGQIRGADLQINLLEQGVYLQQGKLAAHFDQESLHIDTLSFMAPHASQPRDSLLVGINIGPGPGTLNASGTINFVGKNGNLKISAYRLPLAQRADRWIIASGSGSVSLNNKSLLLGGNITVDAGLINQPVTDRPQLSDDIVITGLNPIVRKGSHLSVDASLNLGDHFYLRASGLEARLGGQLSVRNAPGQQLRITGSIAAQDASYEAYGQRLTVERGIVNFQGPLYDPGLNILALRKGLSVEAGVEVTGTALRPVVHLVSTPVVPDTEKLSWIVLGRVPDASGVDSSMLLTAAGSILGGNSSALTSQLKQTLGVDTIYLHQSLNETSSVNKAVNNNSAVDQSINDNLLAHQIITVGKRLSARAFLSYEQGVTAATGIAKLTYTLTPRVSLVTQAGVDNAIDVFYSFNFN